MPPTVPVNHYYPLDDAHKSRNEPHNENPTSVPQLHITDSHFFPPGQLAGTDGGHHHAAALKNGK